MIALPNPFDSVAAVSSAPDAAAAPHAGPGDAAAVPNSASEVMPPVDMAAASAHPAHAAHPAHREHAAAVPFTSGGPQESPAVAAEPTTAGAFDPEAWKAEDEDRYQRFKRTVAELDEPPLFLRTA